ncbi:MAG: ABC transporter ATP-binding protein [Afipia sp.]|jgi:branched-chain amino acid transport system ATP-binding protein|nr:ABC transporter ATP-binding protein [Afipia sp.]
MKAGTLELNDVHKSFGNVDIIRGVSLTVEARERHAVIGPNGAGKSTLFNLISGRLSVTKGTIHYEGHAVQNRPPWEIREFGLSRSFQINSVFNSLSVAENLTCALLPSTSHGYGVFRWVQRDVSISREVERILRELGMEELANVPAGLLPYAGQRFLEIGMTIAGNPGTIILDEPTAGMSRTETAKAIDLIKRISQDRTLIVIEHDMDVVFGLADRITVLVYGEIICTGTPSEVRASKAVQEAYLGRAHS